MMRYWMDRLFGGPGDSLELLREKRREPRRAYDCKTILNVDGQLFEGLCVEASSCGLRVEASASSPLRQGAPILLVSKDRTSRQGRVAWVRALGRTGRVLAGLEMPGNPLPAPTHAERRRYVRVLAFTEVRVRVGDLSVPGKTQEMSLRGLRTRLCQRVPPGTACLVDLPDLGVSLEAEILDCRESRAEHVVRLAVSTLSQKAQATVGSFLKTQLNAA
ncbi:MAG: PilZ domain-containing protein [Candidatus Eremiobacterota bacterium]